MEKGKKAFGLSDELERNFDFKMMNGKTNMVEDNLSVILKGY